MQNFRYHGDDKHFGDLVHKFEQRPNDIKHGGVYAYLPFDNLDKKGKSMYKIGMTKNFYKRESNYHTYLPKGMWQVAFLVKPTKYKPSDDNNKYYAMVERWIFKRVIALGGKVLSEHYRSRNKGETEWVYTDEDTIHTAFEEAQKRFGGKEILFDTNAGLPDSKDKRDARFVGEIFFY